MYFPLVDHLVQEPNDRLLSQENRFLGYYLYETCKTDLPEKRDFDNEIFKMANKVVSFNWWKSSDTHRDSLQHANPDLYPNVVTIIIIHNASVNCYPANDLLARRARRTYVPRWKQSHSQHFPSCMLTETYLYIDVEAVIREFSAKKNRRPAFQFLWVPPRLWICLPLMCNL